MTANYPDSQVHQLGPQAHSPYSSGPSMVSHRLLPLRLWVSRSDYMRPGHESWVFLSKPDAVAAK